ncbi:MAG: single-stranded-DNA-specific exonuclease RecJ [Lachnospiraceae bacterium]|nr:single-stranded-DNA-specific exonuclease RecJ [Lachnospiraceae bacterium]
MEKWFIKDKLADFAALSKTLGVSEVLVRLMVNRGITTLEEMRKYIYPDKGNMHSPYLMKDIKKAVEIVEEKLLKKVHIRIVGDYDVDGVISTFILYSAIKRAGGWVDYEIPDRVEDGYGINISIVWDAINDGVDTLITCDNGIAAIEQIEFAKANGLTVLVLDHHNIVFDEKDGIRHYKLPNADAVVNPHQQECEYPFEDICAGQVAYKFAVAFYESLYELKAKMISQGDKDYGLNAININEKDLEEYLGMAAIATICDVMPLVNENRVFVREGLKIINASPNIGLRALINICDLDEVKAHHLGYVIGPCINASGRLESAKKAMELFLSKDYETALIYAQELKSINEARKELTARAVEEAELVIDKKEDKMPKDKVLVLFLRECHESIAGIVAGRIKERYNRPVFVITQGKDMCKGSGRSIEGYNMYEEMTKVRHLFEKYGGHPLAAGLSIKEENIAKLKSELNKNTTLNEEDLVNRCSIDIMLPISLLNLKIIEELDIMQPFGKDNDKPAFVEKDLSVIRISVIGKNNNVVKMKLRNQYGTMLDGMYFGAIDGILEYIEKKYGAEELDKALKGLTNEVSLSVIYYPQINEYMGNKSINIVISHYR